MSDIYEHVQIELSQQFRLEERLTFQKKTSGAIFYYHIPKELIVNLDQTPLSYVSPSKYTFSVKSVKTVPIKGIDDKRQITATFAISMSGEFLPIQVIYDGKTKIFHRIEKPLIVYRSEQD